MEPLIATGLDMPFVRDSESGLHCRSDVASKGSKIGSWGAKKVLGITVVCTPQMATVHKQIYSIPDISFGGQLWKMSKKSP